MNTRNTLELYGREGPRHIAVASSTHIHYAQRSDATPQAELNALANIYRFIIECHATKEAATENRPEDPERRSDEIRAKASIPR